MENAHFEKGVKTTFSGKPVNVIPDMVLLNCFKAALTEVFNELTDFISERFREEYDSFKSNTQSLPKELMMLLRERQQRLRKTIEIYKSKLKNDCQINFSMEEPAFDFDYSSLDSVELKMGPALRNDVFLAKGAMKGVYREILGHDNPDVHGGIFGKIWDVLTGVNESRINEYRYDNDACIRDLYHEKMKGSLRGNLHSEKLHKLYYDDENRLCDAITGFFEYLALGMEQQKAQAEHFTGETQKAIDITGDVQEAITKLELEKKTLEFIDHSIGDFLSMWKEEVRRDEA